MREQMKSTLDLSVINFSKALYHDDVEHIDKIISSLLLNKNIVYLSVNTDDGRMYSRIADEYVNLTYDDFKAKNGFLLAESDITYDEFHVGNVQLVMSRDIEKAEIAEMSIIMFILLIIIIISISVVISQSTDFFIFNPLSELRINLESIISGNFKSRVDVYRHDDIGILAEAFNKMLDNLGEISEARYELKKQIRIRELSEQRFDLVMKATMDGIYDWDLLTGVIYYSPGWKRMLGYEENELLDDISVWEELIDPESAQESWKMRQEMFKGERKRLVFQLRMKHKDGHWVDILSRAEAFFDSDGKVVRIVGTHTDISTQKQTEKELIRNTDELEGNLAKSEKQRKANLILLNDLNDMTKVLQNEISEHEAAEKALQQSHDQLRELSHHLQNALEEQSSYIAREIHDDLGQSLTSLEMILTFLEDKMEENNIKDKTITGLTREFRNELHATVDKTRKLTLTLRPIILETSDLIEAIGWQIQEFAKLSKADVLYPGCDAELNLDEERELAIYRIIQEALNNINKHANAAHVNIHLERTEEYLKVEIIDDGAGFSVPFGSKAESFGLLNMRERASFSESELSIHSFPGEGTAIKLIIPIDI